jgi:hypothetical protein
MTATVGDVVSGIDGHAGKGLVMFQAIIDHFIPSAIVNLPSIYRERNSSIRRRTNLLWSLAAELPS